MQKAETIFAVMQERGRKGKPVERLYRMLYNPELYLKAYAKLYSNKGAMTPGATAETVDGMSMQKIEAIIKTLRDENYRWTPVRRVSIKKANGKLRPLGLPTWSDCKRSFDLSWKLIMSPSSAHTRMVSDLAWDVTPP